MVSDEGRYPWRTRARHWLLIASLTVAVATWRCDKAPLAPTDPGGGSSGGPAILIGAADVADCGPGAEQTAALLDGISGTVFAAGDLAYMHGTLRNFVDCYEPSWGRHLSRTRPVPGNHEYESAGASPYYSYFGESAGPAGRGYYSYRVGAWKVLALNSETDRGPGSAQLQFMRTELTDSPTECSIAMWHRPLYTSGPNLPNQDVREMFRQAYELGVDIVINGHDHLYERFAPQDADGRFDSARGVRQFIVGTGGAFLYPSTVRPSNSEVVQSTWGILKLTLWPGRYTGEFLSTPGSNFRDAGQGVCH